MLTPSRKRAFEYLDDPALPPDVVAHSLRDISVANRYFGGTTAVIDEMRAVFVEATRDGTAALTVLDVGTGLGDIPVEISKQGRTFGVQVQPIGIELTHSFARVAHKRVARMLTADARALPLADNSVDVVTCSLVLHHLDDADALQMLRECDRVARRRVIVAELARSWIAIGLLWVVSFPLRFHPISRHDGMVSVRRGFLVHELRSIISRTTPATVTCRSRLGWRVTAAWNPGTTSA